MVKGDSNTQNNVSFSNLFYLVSKKDSLQLIGGLVCTLLNGAVQPIFCLLQGEVANVFSSSNTPSQVYDKAVVILQYFIIFGIISFILSTLMMYFCVQFGENQAIKFRQEYYKKLISQDVSYFDMLNSNELSTKMASDCFKIQQAIGEKLCLFLYFSSIVIGTIALAFIRGWQLSLICSIIIPINLLVINTATKITQKSVKENSSIMQAAGGLTEQTLSNIRTVKSLQGEKHESQKYSELIQNALQKKFRFNFISGISAGLQSMFYFLNYTLPFWVGSIFVEREVFNDNMGRPYDASDINAIFACILIGGIRLNMAINSYKIFYEAKIACADILKVLKSIPIIQQNDSGIKINRDTVKGEFVFENVSFSYPSRKQQNLLKNVSFSVLPQKKTAIVGKSGCGKSTILQLIEHFYEPDQGRILLDGKNLKDVNLNSLRNCMGFVTQEPFLLATTIRENLRYAKPDATEEEMIEVLKQVNIWDFIETLDKKLDSFVGNSGSQLSGGQKQRICIARAILRNPPILLLDEATSALDCKNEVQVQAALDQASIGRTTIIIAHNLQTIKNADLIIVIDQGEVIEQGSHEQLISQQGFYYRMQNKDNKIHTKADLQQNQNQSDSSSSCDSSPLETISPIPLFQNHLTKLQSFCCTKNTLPTLNDLPQSHLKNQSQDLNTITNFDDKSTIQINDIQKKSLTSFNSPIPDPQNKLIQRSQRIEQIKNSTILQIATKSKKLTATPKFFNEQKEESFIQVEELNVAKDQKMTSGQIIKRLFSYDKTILLNLSIGMLFSVGNGLTYPLCGLILGKLIPFILDVNRQDISSETNIYCLYLTLLGFFELASTIFQQYFTSKAAQKISLILRQDLFNKFLRMPVAWYDQPQNSSSSLALNIQQSCDTIHSFIQSTVAYNIQAFVSISAAILIAFFGDWKTSLIGIAIVPFYLLSFINYALKIGQLAITSHKSSLSTVGLINESACNIRTIKSFGSNELLVENFSQKLYKNIESIKQSAISCGIAIGFTNMLVFFFYGATFFGGAFFFKNKTSSVEGLLISIECLIISASGLGKSAFFLGDGKSAIAMAKKVFNNLDSKDEFQSNQGKQVIQKTVGQIEFQNVSFAYPERKDQLILKNISFKIPAKSKVAFVGTSGAGKSSIIQLLQRFYSNYSGKILLDGVELRKYDLENYRSKFGSVQQEPLLFNGTIRENIQYNQEVNFEQVKEASKKANALQFIEEFSKDGIDGFDKQVGIKGNKLSGGQKQRIALSQLILRNPQIVLFDEATSALDSNNEQIIQNSIEQTFREQTIVNVAHRINVIKNCDIIFMLDQGKVVEQGTFQELFESKSHFYKLISNSQLN
ncbi:hypothetical protein ABPG74_012550 [Tetrahymena malaccensis]